MSLIRWLGVLLCCVASLPAHADELRPGYLELTQQSAQVWRMTFKAPVKGGLAAGAQPVLPGFCKPGVPSHELREGSLITTWRVNCERSLIGARVGLSGLDATVNDALVRIAPLGRPVQAARLTSAVPMTEIVARAGASQVAATYFVLGVQHILGGYDHLLFVLSLVLLLGGGWVIARTVTAFTIAHSITLAGATLGFLGVNQKPVEICIALSIVFLAVEVVKRDPNHPRLAERVPWVVAFLFGLLHGFGFAGALAEIGMPEGEVPMALLTFNLGVEVGQLAIVGTALLVLTAIRRFAPRALRPTQLAAAYAIGVIATVWFIGRVLA